MKGYDMDYPKGYKAVQSMDPVECLDCGNIFEEFVPYDDPRQPLTCPLCKGPLRLARQEERPSDRRND